MKFFDKLGLALFSIFTLIISVILLLIGFNFISPSVFSSMISNVIATEQGTYILIGVCFVLILLSIKCLFFSSYEEKEEKSEGGILLQNEDGKLLITRNTISNIVDDVVKNYDSINSAETNVIIDKENNVNVNISLDVKAGTVIKDISSTLQVEIKKNVKKVTDVELNEVNVEIQNIDSNANDEEENKETKKDEKKDKSDNDDKEN